MTYNFFVNNPNCTLVILAKKKQLHLVIRFCKDARMTFGEDKCTYQQVEKES